MNSETSIEVAAMRPQSLIRQRTLTRLRWFAIAGQTVVTLFVQFVLKFDLPLIPIGLAILSSILVNLWVIQTKPLSNALTPNEIAAHLIFDTAQIGVVLGFAGGILNPFSVWLLLAPMLAAFALEKWRAYLVIGAVIAVLTITAIWHTPMPGGVTLPHIYIFGSWAALMLGVTFTAAYARQVAVAQSKLTTALEATQAVLSREERLTAVGGLAAAAAHELGTPLSTILVTAREMEGDLPDGPLKEDAQLLISQTQRCQKILMRLSDVGSSDDVRHAELTLEEMLHQAAKPFLNQEGPDVHFVFDPDSDLAPPERLKRQPAIIYGLRTLIENAVKFADKTLRISARWDQKELLVIIEDDGPGFPPDVLKRLGEPFARQGTTRYQTRRQGLGLGFFIAKTLLERTGATLCFGNGRRLPGAWVEISWPIANLYVKEKRDISVGKEKLKHDG
ncbi:ActS/PrrB/RegB family redox-sensitive histidine kinase [Parvularcula marina]|uniref:ActS/PrrB/RegB family redox-sensitive histidine kinase n=1 Tax=Parvularcula marina TaxID=2292771 RepID=UPI0035146E04